MARAALGDGAHGAGRVRRHQPLVGQARAQDDQARQPHALPRRGLAIQRN